VKSIPTLENGGEDLIDRIANALPIEVRAAYYRELTHCRSLPENDEMLRILRAMQFLTLLMNDVPERVIAEREELARLFTAASQKLERTLERSNALHTRLEQQLAELPAEVARGIHAPVIAREITESLRQQFAQSTIPDTAGALSAVAADLRKVTAEFVRAARAISDSHHGAASEARRSVEALDSSVGRAAETAGRAASELSAVFQQEFRWSLYALTGLALMIGIMIGVLYPQWIGGSTQPPTQLAIQEPQPAPPSRLKPR
jgi:hypothetical protein